MGGGVRREKPGGGRPTGREARLKAALKANLRRRKARPASADGTAGQNQGDPGQPGADEAGEPGPAGRNEGS